MLSISLSSSSSSSGPTENDWQSTELTSTWVTSIFIDPVKEKIHRPNFSYLMILSVEPQDLLTAHLPGMVLGKQRAAIIPLRKREHTDYEHASPGPIFHALMAIL